MNTDTQSLAWAITWLAFSIVGLTGALLYFADKRSKKHSR